MTAINSNRAIRGPVTAVPVVAGKGVRLVADTENNRWIVEADETVLWEDTMVVPTDGSNLNATITLSESIANFERIGIYLDGNFFAGYCEITAAAPQKKCIVDEKPNSTAYIGYYLNCATNTTLTYQCGFKATFIGAYAGEYWGYGKVVKVVGINRIQSA